MNILSIIKNIFAAVGIVTTLIAIYELYKKFFELKKTKRELQRKIALLESTEYFIAHIIHLGGESSMTYSMQVFSNEEGGYYFNPPKDFVNVSFNRGGDSTVVMPTELSKKSTHADICHLVQSGIKNEHFVKFVKSQDR